MYRGPYHRGFEIKGKMWIYCKYTASEEQYERSSTFSASHEYGSIRGKAEIMMMSIIDYDDDDSEDMCINFIIMSIDPKG